MKWLKRWDAEGELERRGAGHFEDQFGRSNGRILLVLSPSTLDSY